MSNIKTINQARYDKELRTFIDKLSKIKIDFKLNAIEKQTIQESGEAALLYSICMMKTVMRANDVEIRETLGLRANFYKYLKVLLKDEMSIFTEITLNYFESLQELENGSEEDVTKYFMNFFVQGQEYIRENYYPEDSPFKDPEFLDYITDMEEKLEQIQEEGFKTDTLKLEFTKTNEKVETIALELNNKKEEWAKKLLKPSTIKKEDLVELLVTSTTLLEEYELLANLTVCAIEKQEDTIELCDELIFFITGEGLLNKFNQVNESGFCLTVEDSETEKNTKKARDTTKKPRKKR